MGKEVVYLICSIAKLEVTSRQPRYTVYQTLIKLVVAFHVGNLDAHQIIVFTSHAPEPQHFWHFGNHRDKAAIPFAAVMLRFYQHKGGQAEAYFFRIQQGDFADKNTVVLQPFQTLPAGVVVRLTASASACKEGAILL